MATPAPEPTRGPKWHLQQSSRLRETGDLLIGIAVLVMIAGVVVGFILITHTVDTCKADDFGGGCTNVPENPFIGAGIGVIAAGIVQGLVLMVLGQLARGVSDTRALVSRLNAPAA